jgi:hypothetical protein
MKFKKQPWFLAILYVVTSLLIEAAAMIIGHLRPPQDNAILAPIVLTIPPVLAAWLCGYRRPKEWAAVAVLLSVLTLVITIVAGKITGISTGMIEPIIDRVLAGFLAGAIVNRMMRDTEISQRPGAPPSAQFRK